MYAKDLIKYNNKFLTKSYNPINVGSGKDAFGVFLQILLRAAVPW